MISFWIEEQSEHIPPASRWEMNGRLPFRVIHDRIEPAGNPAMSVMPPKRK
jgi:hypothetical protein